jgi:hypothetical protein
MQRKEGCCLLCRSQHSETDHNRSLMVAQEHCRSPTLGHDHSRPFTVGHEHFCFVALPCFCLWARLALFVAPPCFCLWHWAPPWFGLCAGKNELLPLRSKVPCRAERTPAAQKQSPMPGGTKSCRSETKSHAGQNELLPLRSKVPCRAERTPAAQKQSPMPGGTNSRRSGTSVFPT